MSQETSAVVRKLETYFDEPQKAAARPIRAKKELERPGVLMNAMIVCLMSLALTATKIALWATRKVNRLESRYQS